MADPLSIAASIAGIISLTDTVFRYAFKYARSVSGAKDDIRQLSDEINSFSAVLRSLHALACDLQAQGQEFDCALRVDYLAQCQHTFEKVKKRLKKASDDLEGSSKVRRVARQLKWPYSASETKELLEDVSRQKNAISLATSADTMRQLQLLLSKQSDRFDQIDQSLARTSQKIEISTQILLNSEKKVVLDFFMPPSLNPQRNLDQSIKWRQPTTGTWLLESEELKQWYTTPGSCLWLKGIPGGGKTVLAGAVIQEALEQASTSSDNIGVAFFFCDYKNEMTHTPTNILGSIAYQIALQKDDAFELLKNYYEELHPARSLTRPPDTDELRATIRRMSEHFDHLYIIIDGVDECRDVVEDVAIAIQDLADCTENTSIALFSREEDEIEAALDEDFRHIIITARTEDIETYIRAEMMLRESNGRLIVKDVTVKEKIEGELVRRAKGMFRWVACQLDYMSELWSDADRLEALDRLPETLHDSYFRILRRINRRPAKTQDMIRLCMRVLAFFPERLTIEELCQAISTPATLGANLEQIIDPDSVARKCSSLIRKSADGRYFEFAHFTVQEFLSDETLASLPEFSSYRISKAADEPVLGLLCLKFIQLKNFESGYSNSTEAEPLSFYPYAAIGWPRLTASGLKSPELLHAAGSLFRPTPNQTFTEWLSMFIRALSYDMKGSISPGSGPTTFEIVNSFRPLHVAAALNLPEMCSFLIQEGVNVQIPCSLGTPIELCLSSLLRHYDGYTSEIQRDMYAGDLQWLEWTLSSSERRKATIACLQEAGARLDPGTPNVFLHSLIISWTLNDFLPSMNLLSDGIIPTESEIDRVRLCFEQLATSKRFNAQLGRSIESFNDYLLTSSILNTNWGFKLGKIIWNTAVGMELTFTMDVSRTSSRIALSLDALKAQISFAIADDNRQSLAVYLDDGRITVDEVGCWTLWPSDSLLHNAIMRRAFNCMDLLLERGSDPCARSDKNRDAVLLSGELENLDLLEVLVRHGVSLLSVDEYGCNIWHLAAESFLKESRDYRNVLFGTHFQESQKGILMKNIDGRTPLDLALNLANSITDEEIVLELISHCGNAPFFWENNGPIFPTAFNFQSEAAIRLLLQYRLDSEQSGFNSAKPLHHLDKSVSLEWVRFLLTLYPEDHKSRHIGRLPVELYVDDCIRAAALPKNEILIELTFDGFFESCDDEGHDPWKFLCLAGERLGYSVLFNGWDALQSALGHYIQHGCLASYEDHNMEFGMQPLFEMLIDMAWQTDWPYPIMDIDILNRELALSRYWTPKSQSMIHFLKVAISRLDVDIVKTLLNNSVPVDCAEGDRGTTIQYILDGEVAVDLCSGAEGREILSAILNTQTLESLKACPVDDQKGGLLYNLIHRDWKEPDARWIVEQIVKKGVDIDGLVGSPTDAFGMTPLTWHLNHNSLAIAEVLVSMGASLNGTDYLPKNVNKFDVLRPVHACSRSGNVACLRRMFKLSQRTDVSVLWEATCRWQFNLRRGTLTETMTGFQISCFKGHLDCVSFFLEDVSVNNQFSSRGGCTALHFAAMGGDTVIIEQLIRYGFDIMAEDIEQMTPLHFAVQEHQTDAVSTLIKLGAESSVDKFGRTPLRLAELAGTEEVTNILRTRFQINGYASNDDKVTLTLLHHLKSAIELGDLPACQDLISQGCPLHIPIPRSGSLSVLAYSLVKDRIPIAEWLLQKGPSVLGAPTFAAISQDALMVASAARDPVISILLPNMLQLFDHLSRKSFDFVFQLVAKAARSENEAGLKAILVYLHTHTITSKVLAEFAIRHEKNDFNINYSLHRAVQKGHCGIVRLLLENGIPVDSINAYANTPLMFARTPEMVDLLVEFDASPTPLLTDCLAPSLHFWDKSSTQILERLLTAFQQRNGLSSMKWLDVSLKIYHDLEDPSRFLQFPLFLSYYHIRCSEVFNYLAALPDGIGVGPLLQSDIGLCEVEPFPWHSYPPDIFSQITFLEKHHRLLFQRFGRLDVQRWANLEPTRGWSPLCRAASQNCTKKMENCLGLGADIEFEGCPLGSALMIASACGQLDSVKFLIRRNASVCYEGQVGRLSVFKVATSKAVRNWLLVGRFNDQQRIRDIAEHDEAKTNFWSGFVQARIILNGVQHVRYDESRLDCAKRFMAYKRALKGRVAPHVDGLTFNRHRKVPHGAFSRDGVVDA